MRVFLTGGTGFIGSAVVRELIESGHPVTGLARSEQAAAKLAAAGAGIHPGSLDDLDSLRSGSASAEGVIHLAFNNDFVDYARAVAGDLRAVEAIGTTLIGSGKPFIIASGTLRVASLGRVATEEDQGPQESPRGEAEDALITLAKGGVRSSAVRLAPCVHDAQRQGLASRLVELARAKGVSAYIGDGMNHWPAVHRLDAAHLFRLALESAPAGTRLHGVAEPGIPFRDIAEAIGRNLKLPVVGLSPVEAEKHFGWFAQVVSLDNPTSSALTQDLLSWRPAQPALIADIDRYFMA
jgi:nucleoside-diphosphate-sugar epimerase